MYLNRAKFKPLASTALMSTATLLAACSSQVNEEVGSVSQRVVVADSAPTRANPAPTRTTSSAASAQAAIQDRHIVVFKKGTIGKARGRATNSSAGALKDSLRSQFGKAPGRVYSKAFEGMTVSLDKAAKAKLESDPNVAYVVPDSIVTLDTTQSLPDQDMWGLDRIDQRQWLTAIDTNDPPADNQYIYNGTGKDVHVYIIDSGLNLTHNEFAGRVLPGFDAVEDDAPDDCNGHGTHVAGIAVGTTYGVAKQAFVHPVKIGDCGKYNALSDVLAGIDWVGANLQRPAVVNLSLGGAFNQAFNDAVTSLIGQGAVVTASAGNDYFTDACTKSPGSAPQALTVGAMFLWDSLAPFTNIGPCVDLFAPGKFIGSSWIGANDATNQLDGTSQAAPRVAGVAALLLGQYPEMTPAQVHTAILAAATPNTLVGGDLYLDPVTNQVAAPPFPSGTANLNLYMGSINTPGRGALFFGDQEAACFDGVKITVRDANRAGAGSVSITVNSSTGDVEQVTLTESPANSGEFSKTVNFAAGNAASNNGVVQTAQGGLVTASYFDNNVGNGTSATITGDIPIDCTAPTLGAIRAADVFSTGANIAFDLSEYANVTVNYGTACNSLGASTPARGTSPLEGQINIRNLTANTRYYYKVTAIDRAGNTRTYDNANMCYEFTTATDIYKQTFESSIIMIPGSSWHTTNTCAAPLPGHSASKVLYSGSDINCNYDSGVAAVDPYVTPAISVNFNNNPTVSFKYYSAVSVGDRADVELVVNGGTPILIASSNFDALDKRYLNLVEHWSEFAISLAGYGTGAATIQLRFVLTHDATNNQAHGFSVDDIVVAGGGCKPEIHEAEDMTHATGGAHPLGWNIWDNNYIGYNQTFVGGQQYMVVTAEGTYAGGAWPRMSVRVNNTEVFATDVTSTDWTDYGFWFNAPAGSAQVRIYFTNDYIQGTQDRNLFIEKVVIPCHATPPTGGNLAAQLESFSTWPTGYCSRLRLTNNAMVPTSRWTAVINTGTAPTYTSWNPNYANSAGNHTANSVNGVNSVILAGQTLAIDKRHGFCVETGSGAPPTPTVSVTPFF